MPADILDLVRAADPAAGMPAGDDARQDRLRLEILGSPTPRRTRAGRRNARLVLVAFVLAGALVAVAGWTVYSTLITGPESAHDEFRATQAKIELPAGATWREPRYPDALYGRHMGLITALGQATCAWFGEWDAAASAGDQKRVVLAESAVARIRALMPLHEQGAPEEAGGYDAASLAFFDRMVADAKHGRLGGVRRYAQANC